MNQYADSVFAGGRRRETNNVVFVALWRRKVVSRAAASLGYEELKLEQGKAVSSSYHSLMGEMCLSQCRLAMGSRASGYCRAYGLAEREGEALYRCSRVFAHSNNAAADCLFLREGSLRCLHQ